MRLLRDYIEIKVEQPENKTKSGFKLQEIAKTYQPVGEIVGVGPEVTDLQKGDKVLFLRFAALDSNDKDVKICREKHIIKVL